MSRLGIVIYDLTNPLLIQSVFCGVVLYNVAYLKINPKTPRILSFARYKRERKKGYEDILTIPQIIDAAKNNEPIDCEDFACAWAAEEIIRGRDTKVVMLELTNPKYEETLEHILNEQNGKLFDPSVVAGMPPNSDPETRIRRIF